LFLELPRKSGDPSHFVASPHHHFTACHISSNNV
jgi:hypothetical protein